MRFRSLLSIASFALMVLLGAVHARADDTNPKKAFPRGSRLPREYTTSDPFSDVHRFVSDFPTLYDCLSRTAHERGLDIQHVGGGHGGAGGNICPKGEAAWLTKPFVVVADGFPLAKYVNSAPSPLSVPLGYDVRIIPAIDDVAGIPTSGKGLIIVAVVANVLHLRIFDDTGGMVVDTEEGRLIKDAKWLLAIDRLKGLVGGPWRTRVLTKAERNWVIEAVTSAVDYHQLTPPTHIGDPSKLPQLTLDLDTGLLTAPDGRILTGYVYKRINVRFWISRREKARENHHLCAVELSRTFPSDGTILFTVGCSQDEGRALCQELLKSVELKLRDGKADAKSLGGK